MEKHYSILPGIAALCLAVVACRPIIAIGWPELITLVILIGVLLGPLLFRLYRFLDKVQKATRSEDKSKR